MKLKDLKEYVKLRFVYLLVFIAALFLSFNHETSLFGMVLFAANFIREYQQYKSRTAFLYEKRLTPKQYRDQQFIEKWTETRRDGLVRYCLFDGGVITGAILSVCIGATLLFSKILGDITSGPGAIIAIIWKSYAIGFAIAACLYRGLWVLNEKHFNKLSVA